MPKPALRSATRLCSGQLVPSDQRSSFFRDDRTARVDFAQTFCFFALSDCLGSEGELAAGQRHHFIVQARGPAMGNCSSHVLPFAAQECDVPAEREKTSQQQQEE
jgi:hypothetical protein